MFHATGPRILLVLLLGILLVGPSPSAAKVGVSQTPPFDCATITQVPRAECEALVALYDSTDGANWYRKTDWLQIDTPCSWYGVTCSAAGHVTSLELDTNGLRGAIPPELGDLTELEVLDLSYNYLVGAIPDTLGNLSHVWLFHLDLNELTGPIDVYKRQFC